MKIITREFTARERALLIILSLIIVALAYYIAVDAPVRSGIQAARTESEALETQVAVIQSRVDEIDRMRQEMDAQAAGGEIVSRMPSYSGEKEEVDFLHGTLGGTTDYYIGFNQVTREGDQIRRDFSLQYRSADFQSAVEVMRRLERSDIRCLIDDVSVNPADDSKGIASGGAVQVSCTATFYETMHGGVPDRELPEDSLAGEDGEEAGE